MSSSRRGGFTLLETIIAMGVLAMGATASLALLVAAASTGRRAEHFVSSALVADSVLSEVEGELDGSFGLGKLEAVATAAPRAADVGDGPLRAAPPYDPAGQVPGVAGKRPPPVAAPRAGEPRAVSGPPRAFAEDPFAAARTYWLRRDQVFPGSPDYKYDVTLTPIGGPLDEPWEFLVEVTVKWSEKGQARDRVYASILLKKLTHLDNEPPP